MKRRYRVVDVFSDRALLGNPVAVVLDAQQLDSAAMQRIARWTNLSETTFVLPPDVAGATHRVRIFTPASELPFAGHPTLGTAHAVVAAGIVSEANLVQNALVQQCGDVGRSGIARRRGGGDSQRVGADGAFRSRLISDRRLRSTQDRCCGSS